MSRQRREQKMITVREEFRKPMRGLAARGVEGGHARHLAAVRRHATERARGVAGEHDLVRPVPRAAAAEWRLGDRLGAAAGDGDGLELLVAEEPDARAVGTPERQIRAVAA